MGKPRGQVSGIFLAVSVALAVYFITSLGLLSFEYSIVFILALCVFFVSFIRTDFALCILILSMLFSPEIGAGHISGRTIAVRAEDLFLIVIFFGWLAKMAIRKEIGIVKFTSLNQPIFFYIFACLLSTLFGLLRGEIVLRSAIFYVFKYVEYFILFFMVINNLKNERQAKMYVHVMLLTCFLVSCYGLYQIPSGQRVTAPFEGDEGGEPNTFAGYLLLMMAVVIGYILYRPFRRARAVFIGLLGLMFYVFIYTLSRGAWLAFFPTIGVFLLLSRRYRGPLVLLVALGLLILPFSMPKTVHQRIKETFNAETTVKVLGKKMVISESAAARINSWQVGIDQWSRHPFTGIGIPAGNVIDNQYMRVLAETGALGFAIFLWLLASIFLAGLRVFREMTDNPFAQALSIGFLAGMIGIMVHSITSADFILIRIMEPFWFLAAIVVMLPKLKAQEEEESANG